ncbi:MAG: ABC transporter permease, partial [Candidatus Muiribacteriota bacterium]
NTDIRDIKISVLDLDKTVESQNIIQKFTSSRYFINTGYAENISQIENNIQKGTIRAGIIIENNFEKNIYSNNTGKIQILIDGTDSNTASYILKYIQEIVKNFNIDKGSEIKATKITMPVSVETSAFFNPNLYSNYFFIPGVLAMIVTVVLILLSAMAIVREKEAGTIEQIMVTPLKNYEFILGKTIPFALIGFIDVTIIALVANLHFKIPFEGSFLLLYFATAIYLLAVLSIGFLISTVSSTQQQAMMTSFFFVFPAMLLSGFVFPIANMPLLIKIIAYVNPLTYFMRISRGIFLKGADFSILSQDFLYLSIISVITVFIVIFKNRQRISH